MKNTFLSCMICLFIACTFGPDIQDNMTFGTFEGTTGRKIVLHFHRGTDFLLNTQMLFTKLKITPQIAVWMEDTSGKYLNTVYVTAGFGTQKWHFYKPKADTCFRTICMPFWLNRYRSSGHAAPTPSHPLPDAVTGATPTGTFSIKFTVPDSLTVFKLYAEWNRSFDNNGYFNKKRSSFNGQPSAVVRACIDLNDSLRSSDTLIILGRGGETGDDGRLYKDTEMLTTALKVFEDIVAVREK